MLIKLVMMEDVDIGLKIQATLPLATMKQMFMLVGEVDIGLRPATIPPITQVGVVYSRFYRFILVLLMKLSMLIIEVDICIIPVTFIPITQVGISYGRVAMFIHVLLKRLFMVMRGVI